MTSVLLGGPICHHSLGNADLFLDGRKEPGQRQDSPDTAYKVARLTVSVINWRAITSFSQVTPPITYFSIENTPLRKFTLLPLLLP